MYESFSRSTVWSLLFEAGYDTGLLEGEIDEEEAISGKVENSPYCDYFCYMGLGETEYPIMKKVILNSIECQAFVDPGFHKSLIDERLLEILDKQKMKAEPSLARIKPIGKDSKAIFIKSSFGYYNF
jgi:hypothetical protein